MLINFEKIKVSTKYTVTNYVFCHFLLLHDVVWH